MGSKQKTIWAIHLKKHSTYRRAVPKDVSTSASFGCFLIKFQLQMYQMPSQPFNQTIVFSLEFIYTHVSSNTHPQTLTVVATIKALTWTLVLQISETIRSCEQLQMYAADQVSTKNPPTGSCFAKRYVLPVTCAFA